MSSAPLNEVNEASKQRIPIAAAPTGLAGGGAQAELRRQPVAVAAPARRPRGSGALVENPSAASA